MFVTCHMLSPRRQGELGELSAIDWLTRGVEQSCSRPSATVPTSTSIADFGAGPLRIEVKTDDEYPGGTVAGDARDHGRQPKLERRREETSTTCAAITSSCTWAMAGDGSSQLAPSTASDRSRSVETSTARFEISPGKPLTRSRASTILGPPGGVPERSNGMRCKRIGYAFAGSNPASPIKHHTARIQAI